MSVVHDWKTLESLPAHVKEALAVFTEEERQTLEAFWYVRGDFLGIGFVGPGGVYTRFAEPDKAAALDVLDAYYIATMGE